MSLIRKLRFTALFGYTKSRTTITRQYAKMAVGNGDISNPTNDTPKNVFGTTLQLFSKQPMTGFMRDGYCKVPASDFGNHSVAGVVSEEFLDYSASQGNDLRTVGLSGGCKWCLCASRWLEALEGFKAGKISRDGVPKVFLDATNQSALKKVDLKDLEEFKAA